MQTESKIIWHEGMFLQPQHFQQHDRYFEYLINYRHRVQNNHLWGFSELTLDFELLSVGKIGILSAVGIFQDGTAFNMPRNDKVPTPFVIPEGLNNTLLYLAIPLHQSGTAEAGAENSTHAYRYRVIQTEVSDVVAESLETTEVPLGSVATRILTEHDDLSGYACLPIARIKESRSNNKITFDKTFLTVWLDVQEALALSQFITEVHGLLNHRAEMLAGRLTDTQQAGTAEIVDFMLLQLSNKYEPIFHYLSHKKPLHPEQLFYTLIQLMGEMATYTTNKRRPIEPPVYKHDDLFNTFKPIIREVRHALSMVLEQNATSIPLQSRDHGLWVGELHDKQLLEHCSFVLSVYADLPTETIRTMFPSQIKIAPVEQIRTLVSKALPGIPIQSIAIAPRQIPYHSNFSYFALDKHHEQWQYLEKSGGIALHVGTNIPGLKLELWAIKG